MRPPRSHSNSAKLEKKEEKSAKRSENRNGESSSAVENHLTLDPGKISVIYTRPSLIVNSSFYEILFYDSDNSDRFHHTEYILKKI